MTVLAAIFAMERDISLLAVYAFVQYAMQYRTAQCHVLVRVPPSGKKLVIRKRTPFRRRLLIRLLLHNLPRQLHQVLPQLLILRHRAPTLRHRRRTNVLPALRRGRGSEDGADTSLHNVLLERRHADGHGVAG